MHRFTNVVAVLVAAGAFAATASAAADEPAAESPGPVTLGPGTQLLYASCYEHLGRFALPLEAIGTDLPSDFSYVPGPTAGTAFVNVVGLDCQLDDERVIDLFIAAPVNTTREQFTPPGVRANLRVVRRHTTRPRATTRFAQWCFGEGIRAGTGDATAQVTEEGQRTGDLSFHDATGTIALHTETTSSQRSEPAASLEAGTAIQHFTVTDGDIAGKVVFEAGPGIRAFEGTAQLTLDGVRYDGLGAHVYPNALANAFDITYAGLTACPPGLN